MCIANPSTRAATNHNHANPFCEAFSIPTTQFRTRIYITQPYVAFADCARDFAQSRQRRAGRRKCQTLRRKTSTPQQIYTQTPRVSVSGGGWKSKALRSPTPHFDNLKKHFSAQSAHLFGPEASATPFQMISYIFVCVVLLYQRQSRFLRAKHNSALGVGALASAPNIINHKTATRYAQRECENKISLAQNTNELLASATMFPW